MAVLFLLCENTIRTESPRHRQNRICVGGSEVCVRRQVLAQFHTNSWSTDRLNTSNLILYYSKSTDTPLRVKVVNLTFNKILLMTSSACEENDVITQQRECVCVCVRLFPDVMRGWRPSSHTHTHTHTHTLQVNVVTDCSWEQCILGLAVKMEAQCLNYWLCWFKL